MNSVPDTRVSLILRLPNVADVHAWTEFTEVYEPFLYRYAIRRGLQDADARELTQEVFLGVARAVGRWQPDGNRAKFRTWLFRIARNQTVNILTRRRREEVRDSATWALAEATLASSSDAEVWEEEEYRRETFRYAAERVRRTVQTQTWDSFWRTTMEGESPDEVARSLGVSRGLVYVARSRVIRQLKAEIARMAEESEQ